jgi:hypothetical protein
VIVHIGKFIWAVSSCGGHPTADVFARHYELHYKKKKIKLKGSDNTLSTQFGCITSDPSCYGGRAKLTPIMKNKWLSGWAKNWFYYRVPTQKTEVQGKGVYLLCSEMSVLDYLTEAPHSCPADDANEC